MDRRKMYENRISFIFNRTLFKENPAITRLYTKNQKAIVSCINE